MVVGLVGCLWVCDCVIVWMWRGGVLWESGGRNQSQVFGNKFIYASDVRICPEASLPHLCEPL